MSLINDALKKLQAGRRDEKVFTPKACHRYSSSEAKNITSITLYISITILFLLVIGGGLFVFKLKQDSANSKAYVLNANEKVFVAKPIKNNWNEANQTFKEALVDIKSQQIALASAKLYRVITIAPSFNKARELLVALLIQQDKPALAESILNKGMVLSPDYIPFVRLKAHFLMSRKKYEAALTLLEGYSPNIKQHTQYYALKASLDEVMGDYVSADDVYRHLLKRDPENGQMWLGLGVAYQGEGKDNEAINAFTKASTYGGLSETQQVFVQSQLKRS